MDKKKYMVLFIISCVVLALSSFFIILLLAALLIYQLFVKLEDFKKEKIETEMILFLLAFTLFIQFIVFRNLLLEHSLWNIIQSVPNEIISYYYKDFNMFETMYKIGLIPITYGIYAIYAYVFFKKDRIGYLFISFVFAIILFLWARLMNLNEGLMFIGIVLGILFSAFYNNVFSYILKTKFSKFQNIGIMGFIIVFITSSVIPSVNYGYEQVELAPSEGTMELMDWINYYSEEDSVVLSRIDDGNLITSLGKRKNVIDSNFLFLEDLSIRVKDTERFYTSIYETQAIRILDKYDVKYFIVSEPILDEYGVEELAFLGDKKCFKLSFKNEEYEVYRLSCRL